MEKFAICAYKANRKRVVDTLSKPLSDDYRQETVKLTREDCIYSGELRFDVRTFRGSLFAAMFRDRFKRLPDGIATAPAVDYGTTNDAVYPIALGFSDCVVRADARQAFELVNARPATGEETSAIQRMRPTFSQCVSKGRSSEIHKSTLRGFIAESLYKLSVSVAGGAS